MNKYYCIVKVPDNKYQLKDIGDKITKHYDSSVMSWDFINDVKDSDYDYKFYLKLVTFDDYTDIEKMLNYHKKYYIGGLSNIFKRKKLKKDFIKNIKYNILPKFDRHHYKQVVEDWIEENFTFHIFHN